MPGELSGTSPKEASSRVGKARRIERWKTLEDGRVLSANEVMQMWLDAGGWKRDAAMAAAISGPESGRTVGRFNGSCCWGLMQVNADAHGAQYGEGGSEWERMKKAVQIRKASPLKWGPNPWEVCRDARCSNLKAEADKIKKGFEPGPVKGGESPDLNPVDNIGDALAAVMGPVGSFFKIITDPATWYRILKVLAGAIILLVVIVMLATGSNPLRKAFR